MKVQDSIGVDFVNSVIGRGILNGVINISFGVYNFTPNDQGAVDVDTVIARRLRMDKMCAIQLRDVMNELIKAIEIAEVQTNDAPTAEVEGGVILKSAETSH